MESKKQDWWNWGLLLWGLLLFVPIMVESIDEDLHLPWLIWKPILIVIIGLLFILQKKRKLEFQRGGMPLIWYASLVLTLALLVGAYLYDMKILSYVTLIMWMGLVGWYVSSKVEVTRLFALWGLLCFVCGLPGQLELKFLRLVSGLAAKMASPVVDMLGVFNVVQGEVMKVGESEINLEAIANGFFSFHGVAVLAGLLCCFRKRSLWHALLLVLSSFAVSIVMNAIRIVGVGVSLARWDIDIMQGAWQYVLLVASYGVSVLCLLSLDAFFEFFLHEVVEPSGRTGKKIVKYWNCLVGFRLGHLLSKWRERCPNALMSLKLCRGFTSLALVGVTVVVSSIKLTDAKSSSEKMHSRQELSVIDTSRVKFTRPGWKFLKVESEERPFDSVWGAFSFVWHLKYNDTTVVMALDYPFDQWHDVRVCYGKLGWLVEAEGVAQIENNRAWSASETDMSLPTGDYGYILCSHCDHLGSVVQPKPAATGIELLKYKFGRNNWVAPFGAVEDKSKNTFYQTQVMVTTAYPLDEVSKKEIRMMYGEFREQIRALIKQKSEMRKGGSE